MTTITLPLSAWLLVVALSVLAGAGAAALAMWPREPEQPTRAELDRMGESLAAAATTPLPRAGLLAIAPPDDVTRWDIPVTWSEVRAQQDDVVRFAAEYGGLR